MQCNDGTPDDFENMEVISDSEKSEYGFEGSNQGMIFDNEKKSLASPEIPVTCNILHNKEADINTDQEETRFGLSKSKELKIYESKYTQSIDKWKKCLDSNCNMKENDSSFYITHESNATDLIDKNIINNIIEDLDKTISETMEDRKLKITDFECLNSNKCQFEYPKNPLDTCLISEFKDLKKFGEHNTVKHNTELSFNKTNNAEKTSIEKINSLSEITIPRQIDFSQNHISHNHSPICCINFPSLTCTENDLDSYDCSQSLFESEPETSNYDDKLQFVSEAVKIDLHESTPENRDNYVRNSNELQNEMQLKEQQYERTMNGLKNTSPKCEYTKINELPSRVDLEISVEAQTQQCKNVTNAVEDLLHVWNNTSPKSRIENSQKRMPSNIAQYAHENLSVEKQLSDTLFLHDIQDGALFYNKNECEVGDAIEKSGKNNEPFSQKEENLEIVISSKSSKTSAKDELCSSDETPSFAMEINECYLSHEEKSGSEYFDKIRKNISPSEHSKTVLLETKEFLYEKIELTEEKVSFNDTETSNSSFPKSSPSLLETKEEFQIANKIDSIGNYDTFDYVKNCVTVPSLAQQSAKKELYANLHVPDLSTIYGLKLPSNDHSKIMNKTEEEIQENNNAKSYFKTGQSRCLKRFQAPWKNDKDGISQSISKRDKHFPQTSISSNMDINKSCDKEETTTVPNIDTKATGINDCLPENVKPKIIEKITTYQEHSEKSSFDSSGIEAIDENEQPKNTFLDDVSIDEKLTATKETVSNTSSKSLQETSIEIPRNILEDSVKTSVLMEYNDKWIYERNSSEENNQKAIIKLPVTKTKSKFGGKRKHIDISNNDESYTNKDKQEREYGSTQHKKKKQNTLSSEDYAEKIPRSTKMELRIRNSDHQRYAFKEANKYLYEIGNSQKSKRRILSIANNYSVSQNKCKTNNFEKEKSLLDEIEDRLYKIDLKITTKTVSIREAKRINTNLRKINDLLMKTELYCKNFAQENVSKSKDLNTTYINSKLSYLMTTYKKIKKDIENIINKKKIITATPVPLKVSLVKKCEDEKPVLESNDRKDKSIKVMNKFRNGYRKLSDLLQTISSEKYSTSTFYRKDESLISTFSLMHELSNNSQENFHSTIKRNDKIQENETFDIPINYSPRLRQGPITEENTINEMTSSPILGSNQGNISENNEDIGVIEKEGYKEGNPENSITKTIFLKQFEWNQNSDAPIESTGKQKETQKLGTSLIVKKVNPCDNFCGNGKNNFTPENFLSIENKNKFPFEKAFDSQTTRYNLNPNTTTNKEECVRIQIKKHNSPGIKSSKEIFRIGNSIDLFCKTKNDQLINETSSVTECDITNKKPCLTNSEKNKISTESINDESKKTLANNNRNESLSNVSTTHSINFHKQPDKILSGNETYKTNLLKPLKSLEISNLSSEDDETLLSLELRSDNNFQPGVIKVKNNVANSNNTNEREIFKPLSFNSMESINTVTEEGESPSLLESRVGNVTKINSFNLKLITNPKPRTNDKNDLKTNESLTINLVKPTSFCHPTLGDEQTGIKSSVLSYCSNRSRMSNIDYTLNSAENAHNGGKGILEAHKKSGELFFNLPDNHKMNDLRKFILLDLLRPGKNVLSLHTSKRIVFASLNNTGDITSNKGKTYKTPLEWCSDCSDFVTVGKKITNKMCYSKIYYQGRTLSYFKNIYQGLSEWKASHRTSGSSTLSEPTTSLEVELGSITPEGKQPECDGKNVPIGNVLNLAKMKLLLIGNNEIAPMTAETDQWENIDKWD
ncbi:uncharacterized protein MAL8P1.12-like [Parasteatoda tepidariorum]|uniref:uncharacterized protein MAL8P1.12-like n=1 Tax=Parasteatoda tepidariorum TaxID=114398 RepID=UPI0039BD2C01